MRAQGAAVTAAIGAVAVATTAAVTGLESPLGWGAYGLVIGGVCGYVATPSIVVGQLGGSLLLAAILEAAAVLAFPLLGPIFGLEAPLLGGRTTFANLGPMYLATPMGFASAVPFVPASLATAFLAGGFIRISRASPGRSDAIPAMEVVHRTDRPFGRGVFIAIGLEVLLTIVGYLWLKEAVSNHLLGY